MRVRGDRVCAHCGNIIKRDEYAIACGGYVNQSGKFMLEELIETNINVVESQKWKPKCHWLHLECANDYVDKAVN